MATKSKKKAHTILVWNDRRLIVHYSTELHLDGDSDEVYALRKLLHRGDDPRWQIIDAELSVSIGHPVTVLPSATGRRW